MSLRAATTPEESIWQYCNYGYDKTKYTSQEDCIAKKTEEYRLKNTPTDSEAPKTNTIKWTWVIGGTLAIYALLYYVNKD